MPMQADSKSCIGAAFGQYAVSHWQLVLNIHQNILCSIGLRAYLFAPREMRFSYSSRWEKSLCTYVLSYVGDV